jgi:hypothetical protein
MSKQTEIPTKTRRKWIIDVVLLLSGIAAALSGIYFMYLPSGGYQGGRNPLYGITILFGRHTWEELHTWTGLLMVATVAVHLAIHWRWIQVMLRRTVDAALARGSEMPPFARFNVALNLVVAISFLICSVSGIYFLLAPSGGLQGGRNPNWDPGVLISRTTWDLIHTWSGALLTIAVVVHFAIHWQWIVKITGRMLNSIVLQQRPCAVPSNSLPAESVGQVS